MSDAPKRPDNVPPAIPKLSKRALRAAYPKDYYRIYGTAPLPKEELIVESCKRLREGEKLYTEAEAAEKAKADKLALLEEVAYLINPDFCDQEEFYNIKHRIEAE